MLLQDMIDIKNKIRNLSFRLLSMKNHPIIK